MVSYHISQSTGLFPVKYLRVSKKGTCCPTMSSMTFNFTSDEVVHQTHSISGFVSSQRCPEKDHLNLFEFSCELPHQVIKFLVKLKSSLSFPSLKWRSLKKLSSCPLSFDLFGRIHDQTKSVSFLGFPNGSLLTNRVPPVMGLTSMNHLINLISPFSISIP